MSGNQICGLNEEAEYGEEKHSRNLERVAELKKAGVYVPLHVFPLWRHTDGLNDALRARKLNCIGSTDQKVQKLKEYCSGLTVDHIDNADIENIKSELRARKISPLPITEVECRTQLHTRLSEELELMRAEFDLEHAFPISEACGGCRLMYGWPEVSECLARHARIMRRRRRATFAWADGSR